MCTNKVERKSSRLLCRFVALSLLYTIPIVIARATPQVPYTGKEAELFNGSEINGQTDLNSKLDAIQDEPVKASEIINEESLSEDCVAKRNEMLRNKQQKDFISNVNQQSSQLDGEEGSSNVTSLGDNEYLPQCRRDGKFEPVQCHKMIDSCWCVDKFGQPIRNSAFNSKEPVPCDLNLYEGMESLVSGVFSGNKLDSQLFESHASNSSVQVPKQTSTKETGLLAVRLNTSTAPQPDDNFKKNLGGSGQAPSLPLVPNECETSRRLANERAFRFREDSIWIPQCDTSNGKLYAERQCHRSRVCWCVDQSTGLPLLRSQPLAAQYDLNCAQVRQTIDQVGRTNWSPRAQGSFIVPHGLAQTCDIQRRARFMRLLVDQFRMQIGEYMSRHPNGTKPTDLAAPKARELPDSQVLLWKFSLLDADHNGRLEDREWCKFKMDFKLVERPDDVGQWRVGTRAGALWPPLSILRSERLCWRDLLELCDHGRLLVRDSIDLARWVACMGAASGPGVGGVRGGGREEAWTFDGSQANSREAAITRSNTKNPFAGILKPD